MAAFFNFNGGSLLKNLESMKPKLKPAILMFAQNAALEMQNYARDNAPWKDRTAHARQRLTASVQEIDNALYIVLAHGVDYGIWLELAHEKKYEIIAPTIRLKGNEVIQIYRDFLNKIKY